MNTYKTVFLLVFLWACGSSTKNGTTTESTEKKVIKPKYARFFQLEVDKNDTALIILNPWKNGQPTQRIQLSGRSAAKSIVPMSTSFYGYLELLGELDKITGIENQDFVYNAQILERVNSGQIKELGESGVISVEMTVRMNPDLLIISGTEILGPNLNKIQQAGLLILNDMDWQEQHPLGKAEWIKVFGLLLGKKEKADSIFGEIEHKYIALCDTLRNRLPEKKANVILGYNYQGTWFMPGGKSYVAQYLADAGAQYPFNTDTSSGSIPLSSELVFKQYSEYPVWLNPGSCRNKKDLLLLDSRYGRFSAFKKSAVYNNNRRSNVKGGNDFWETSPANPHLVLADLVYIFYPQILPDHQLYFYQPLK